MFRKTSRNFNPLCAQAGKITIAEVEELVEPGEIDPAQVHTPGVFVHRVVALTPEQAADKRIEKRTVRDAGAANPEKMGTWTAPRCAHACEAIATSGDMGRNKATRSPVSTPRAASASARRVTSRESSP